MTKHTAQVLIGGPALVERALGVSLTKDELGGAQVHASSGVIDNLAEDEHDAFEQIKKFLSFLPTSVHERTPRYECDDSVERMEQDLLTAVPRDSNAGFDMRAIVEMIVDLREKKWPLSTSIEYHRMRLLQESNRDFAPRS